MDAGARRAFWEAMHDETSGGRTVVFATHYLEEAQAYAPRTILIDHGRISADRPTDQLRAMVGERTVTASLPEDRRDDALTRLRAMAGVREVRLEGGRVRVEGSASDDVALLLLSELGARDLEVSVPSLESAFLALTQQGRDA
jgi:ABC-2 type transport system ATP-binding protein